MGLAKALRRVCSSQSSSNRQSKQTRPSNRSNTFTKSSTSSRPLLRLRRKPRRSTPSNSLSPKNYVQQNTNIAQTQYQQKQQEAAVIIDYRDRLENFANTAKQIHRALDTEPGDSNAIIHLRSLRNHLHNALESYFAAAGTRSTEGLSSILPTIERTDIRLAAIEQEIITEVSRFDDAACSISARFSVAESSLQRTNVIADADHTLIELEIYRSAWGPIMDSTTVSRLENDSKMLRKVVSSSDQFNITNDQSQFETQSHNSTLQSFPNGHVSHQQYSRKLSKLNRNSIPNGHYKPSQYLASSSKNPHSIKQNGQAVIPSKYPPPPPLPDFSYSYPTLTDNSNYTPIQSNSSNNSGDSIESGDEGPVKMVMSRTRTLRDMAETAMSVDKDDNIEPYDPSINHRCDIKSMNPSTQPSISSISHYRREGLKSDNSPRESSDAESHTPRLKDSKNASFATAFFKTSRVRADSISDAGILLRRSNVRGDGRCLFRALARGRIVAKGRSVPSERIEREEADHLRQKAVAELKKHRKLLTRSFVIEDDFTTYTKKMAHPRTYGGEPELLMLAKVLHVPIAVYIAKNGAYRQIQVYGKMYCGDPLRILYSDGIHYDALLAMQ